MKLVVNGVTLEGDVNKVLETAKLLGYEPLDDGKHYFSKSTGNFLPIAEMETSHLVNAFILMYKEWVDSLRYDPKFLERILDTPKVKDKNYKTFVAMIAELKKRGL